MTSWNSRSRSRTSRSGGDVNIETLFPLGRSMLPRCSPRSSVHFKFFSYDLLGFLRRRQAEGLANPPPLLRWTKSSSSGRLRQYGAGSCRHLPLEPPCAPCQAGVPCLFAIFQVPQRQLATSCSSLDLVAMWLPHIVFFLCTKPASATATACLSGTAVLARIERVLDDLQRAKSDPCLEFQKRVSSTW